IKKGLWQGDQLYPIVFNIILNMQAIFISRAMLDAHVRGVIPYLLEDGFFFVQCPDDMIIFMNHDLEAKNMKLILCAFEQLYGPKINFLKEQNLLLCSIKNYETSYLHLFFRNTKKKKKSEDSQFWMSVMSIRDQFLNLARFKLSSGDQIMFREYKLLDNRAGDQYPNIFDNVRRKHATAVEVFSSNPLIRALAGVKLCKWRNLVARLLNINLVEGIDCFVWSLKKSGMFICFVNNGTKANQETWCLKVQLKLSPSCTI
ncbi:LOW QUALITY PROTEIN: hypothetical protein U9M48_000394, partial [Paspalum notatum var. saurae]